MTENRWRQIEHLFEQALKLAPAERSSFLIRECNGDDDLRRELQSLLDCDAPDQHLVTLPTITNLTLGNEGSGPDMTGRRIGPYRLAGVIGRGGMGSVYLGIRDDAQFQKNVAIKLLKRGMDTDIMLERFRQERQILANLEHPFIARLLDGGATDDGLPYFVMEYVDGLPIGKYCTEKNAPLADRLRLFRLVCEAVQHAHQNLVVHRDIKPSNILTTKEGIPKLLDFGIAKVLHPGVVGDTTMTQREDRMLTPDYASPEQVKGLPISTASDIYSLGAVLYQLLTGEKPHRFTSNSLGDLEKTVCEVEPLKPSVAAGQNQDLSPAVSRQLKRRLSGDLDNIILTAMRKEPQRRYASAAEFSEDIRRHMEGLPILAREDRWTYRASKFVFRNKLGVAAALLLTASLIGGIVSTTYQARRAERRFKIVRGLANSVLFDLHDKVQQLPGSTRARASMIETVLGYLDNLAKDAGEDPGLQLEIAQAYHRIGAIEGHPDHANLGRTAAALQHYRKSLEMLKPLTRQAETRIPAIEETIRVDVEAGDIELSAGRLDAAKALFTDAAALGELVEQSPGSQVFVYFRLGGIEAQQGGAAVSMEPYRKALEHAISWAAVSRKPEAVRALSSAYTRVAGAARETGDPLTCRTNLRMAQQVMEERLRQPDANIDDRRTQMSVLLQLAQIEASPDDLNLGDYESSLRHYRTALAMAEEFVAADRHDIRVRRDLALAQRRIGRLLLDQDPAAAWTHYSKAAQGADDLLAMNPASIDFRRDVAESYLGMGILLRKAGKLEEALDKLARALEMQKAVEAAAPFRIWLTRYMTQIYTEIGNVLMDRGDADGAWSNHRQALAAADRFLQRAPGNSYLERDRADVMEAMGAYFLKRSAQPGLTPVQQAQFKTEARSHLQNGLAIWRDWTKRKIGGPYAIRREKHAVSTLSQLTAGQ